MSKNKVHSNLHFFRSCLMTPIAFVMIVLITSLIGMFWYNSMCENQVASMKESILVARNSYSFVEKAQKSNFSFAERVFTIRLNVINNLLAGGESIQKSMSLINEMGTDSVQCYYRYSNGEIIPSGDYQIPDLTEYEWNTLRTTGKLLKGDSYYLLASVNGKDEFISYCPVLLLDRIFSFDHIPEKCLQDILVFNEKDGLCICSSDGFAGVENSTCKKLSDFVLVPRGDCESDYIVYNYKMKNSGFFNGGIAVEYRADYGIVFLSVVKNRYLLARLFMWILPFFMLLTTFYFIMLKICFNYRKMWEEGSLRNENAKHIGKINIDPKLLKSAVSFVLPGFAITFITACLILVLNFKTGLNYAASENLHNLSNLYERYCDTENKLTKLFENNAYRMTDFVSDSIENTKLFSRDKLVELAEMTDIERIDVYDRNGVIVAGSSGYEGYTLSDIETDPEYNLWPVINGETQNIVVFTGNDRGLYYAATKRKDSVGMIRLTMSNAILSQLYDALNIESLLVNSDSGVSDILCIDRSNPGLYYLYDSDSCTVSSHVNDFKEGTFVNNYVTSIKLNGKNYTAYTIVTDSLVLVCLNEPVSYIHTLFYSALVFGLGCLLLIALIFIGTLVYTEEIHADVPPVKDNNILHGFQRKMLFKFVNTVFITACLYYMLDWLVGIYPVIPFLMERHWSYGISFYSFVCAVLDIACSFIICAAFHFVCGQLEKLFNTRSKTIVRLSYSVVCVVAVAVALVLALRQLGIDMTTILGGLGLTGLALSLGAQSTLADLIAGISMILDKHVQIGDYVQVNDFDGEIIDINIRTTKIKSGNVIKSVQNSSMVNVSRIISTEGAIPVAVNFVIPYSVSKEAVVSAIRNNENRFAEAVPDLFKSGIVYLNISAFEVYGVKYVIVLRASPSKYNNAVHTILSVVKQIMEENGIAFAESVIHVTK